MRLIELDRDSDSGQVDAVFHFPGDLYMYQKRLPNEGVAKLYIKQGLSGPEKLVIDPARKSTVKPADVGISQRRDQVADRLQK